MNKAAVCLISSVIILLIGAFFGYFILPLGLLGASSERMMNLSFVIFIFWALFVSLLTAICGFFTLDFLIAKTSWSGLFAMLAAIVISVIFGVVLIFVGWIVATIVGNQ